MNAILLRSLFLASFAGLALAQNAIPTHKIGNVVVSGSFRTRLEAWDWFPSTNDNAYGLSGNILRVSFAQTKENFDWNVELAVPFLLGLPERAQGTGAQGALGLGSNYYTANQRNRNAAMLFPKQAYVRWKSPKQSLRLGRFEYNDGSETTPKSPTLNALKNTRINQRLIGAFAWAHVGRSFDGLHYQYAKGNRNFTAVSAVPTRGVFQVDGWGWNQAAFGYGALTQMWGKGTHAADTRVFGLYYHDFRDVLKTDNRPLAVRQADVFSDVKIFTFGGHSVHAFTAKAATYDLLFWGAGQTGKWGKLDHRAGSFVAEAGVQPKLKFKPWIRGGYTYGSGDSNSTDGKHGTFFQNLPTPRPFARFPFFDMINNRDIFASLVLRPHAKWTISNEYHFLSLAQRNDLWYQGGGVFQPWTFGYAGRPSNGQQSLADLYDVSVEWRTNARVTFTGYVGFADGKDVVKKLHSTGATGKFGYLEMTYRF